MIPTSFSSSAAVRVEKATSEFLIGPDWTLNMDICDIINSNQTLSKDVVKALKKRLQHKNPKVQLLALTLLETMVKNCGDYVHCQIAERNILPEMVKIIKKKVKFGGTFSMTDLQVRDKILTLIGSWHETFGGPGGRLPQYYIAYEDLRRSGIQFPQRSPDAVPIITPPATHPTPRQPQPGYGLLSGSSTRLDEAMAAEESFSLSSLNSMREVLNLLADMLKAIDSNDCLAIRDEVIIDLVEQCRANQRKLVKSLEATADEELLGQGLEMNDRLQTVLAKHDAIASGSPVPSEVTKVPHSEPDKYDSNVKSTEVSMSSTVSNDTPPASVAPAPVAAAPAIKDVIDEAPTNKNVIDEDEEEEDDFAQLARRHSKNLIDADHSDAPSNALVPVNAPTLERSKDQDMIDLLSLALSTPTSSDQTSDAPTSQMPSTRTGVTFSSEAYPGVVYHSYVAPWAQPQHQPQPQSQPQPQFKPEYSSYPQAQLQLKPDYVSYPQPQAQHIYPTQIQLLHSQPEMQLQPEMQPQYHETVAQPALYAPCVQLQYPQYNSPYPPPPWAATPGYFSSQNAVSRPLYTYPTGRPSSPSPIVGPSAQVFINGEVQVNSSLRSDPNNAGLKPFIPPYRLFEDLDVFSNPDRRFNGVSNPSPRLGSNNQHMVGGRK